MNVDVLRKLIRAAIVAAPLAGCGARSTPAEEAPPARAAEPAPSDPLAPTAASDEAPAAQPMDTEEFDRMWESSLPPREDAQPATTTQPSPDSEIVDPGRPLRAGGHWRRASAVTGCTRGPTRSSPLGESLAPRLRARVARAWTEMALAEHASIASFGRAALELMAVGAPVELVDAHLGAGRDEARHASLAFAIARAYGSHVAPGPLDVPAPRGGSLARVGRDVFVEGCLNETAAALVASRSAALAEPSAVRDALSTIAADEARHAALAWKTVAWALRSDPSLAEALREELAAAAELPDAPGREPDHATLARHGVLDRAALIACHRDARSRIVEPLLEEVSSGRGQLGA